MKFHHIGIIVALKSEVNDFCRGFGDKIIMEQYVQRYQCWCYFLKKSKIEFVIPTDKSPAHLKGFSGLHHIAFEMTKDEVKPFKGLLSEKNWVKTKLFKINFLESIMFKFPMEFIQKAHKKT